MGTLASELAVHARQLVTQPRVYVDANIPAGLVALMREQLGWDVLFVLEHEQLRRASDGDHYRLAWRLRRTLITLDRDYLDDRAFPPPECAGVLVLAAPDERALGTLIRRLDREVFRAPARAVLPVPLEGRKLHLYPGWTGEGIAP